MPLVETQERIDERFGEGRSLAEVEEEIIDPAPFSEEQRAALWLYASATLPVNLGEAMVETAKQPHRRLGRLNTTLRSAGSAAMFRMRRPFHRGKVPHGGA
jgi:hypothetical protein